MSSEINGKDSRSRTWPYLILAAAAGLAIIAALFVWNHQDSPESLTTEDFMMQEIPVDGTDASNPDFKIPTGYSTANPHSMIVFLSGSGSCPPKIEEINLANDVLTLTLHDYDTEKACTTDLHPIAFKIASEKADFSKLEKVLARDKNHEMELSNRNGGE